MEESENDRSLKRRFQGAFEQVTKTRSAIHLTFVTTAGLLQNKYSGIVQSEVTLDDLFGK